MKRLIVVPTYNEEKNLGVTLQQLKGQEFIVVDGFSTDNTIGVAEALGAKVIRREKPTYAHGVMTGLRYGYQMGYDQLIVMDAESHTFSDIVRYLEADADVIAGRRDNEKKPLLRKFISRVGRVIGKVRSCRPPP